MLELRQLCKHFENADRPTLSGVDLTIPDASFTCIVERPVVENLRY